jgi:isopentenyldiphosphate isomerase
VIKHKNKILIVKRSDEFNFYPGYWNGISGFLDDSKTLEEKAREEIKEELGIGKKDIISLKPGSIFDQEEKKYKKIWITHPVLVKIKTNKIKLDWEAQDFCWVTAKEIKKIKLMPGFDKVLRTLLKI